jgi:hypothetical protein
VEEEVPFEVGQVRAAGGDVEADLAGEGVPEPKGVGEVPEDGDLEVREGLRRPEPGVPGQLRGAGELRPDRPLHELRVELAELPTARSAAPVPAAPIMGVVTLPRPWASCRWSVADSPTSR